MRMEEFESELELEGNWEWFGIGERERKRAGDMDEMSQTFEKIDGISVCGFVVFFIWF